MCVKSLKKKGWDDGGDKRQQHWDRKCGVCAAATGLPVVKVLRNTKPDLCRVCTVHLVGVAALPYSASAGRGDAHFLPSKTRRQALVISSSGYIVHQSSRSIIPRHHPFQPASPLGPSACPTRPSTTRYDQLPTATPPRTSYPARDGSRGHPPLAARDTALLDCLHDRRRTALSFESRPRRDKNDDKAEASQAKPALPCLLLTQAYR